MPFKGARGSARRQPHAFGWGLTIGLAGACALSAMRLFQSRQPALSTATLPAEPVELRPWVEPLPDGSAPESHPVKAKLASGIYHVPTGFNYPRTKPDRCYLSAEAAEADGFRPAKR